MANVAAMSHIVRKDTLKFRPINSDRLPLPFRCALIF